MAYDLSITINDTPYTLYGRALSVSLLRSASEAEERFALRVVRYTFSLPGTLWFQFGSAIIACHAGVNGKIPVGEKF